MAWQYVEGMDRNEQDKVVSHIYAYQDGKSSDDIEGPLCARGWNRSNGNAFSIFRGNPSAKGTCAICKRRQTAGAAPVPVSPHKTKWI